jgi:putative DNA primase/helicase
MLATYADAVDQSADYLERVAVWFMISAVARIEEPGCKVDYCLVLEGQQGAGKSTLARLLLPAEEWFAEHNVDVTSKDVFEILQGRWVIELGEMASMSRAETAQVKRYLTTATDAYRRAYGRRTTRVPRQCVFIGTVNDAEYLKDDTGNRRFWPVAVGTVDTEALRRDRDQLWAEAAYYYREGYRWWPDRADAALLADEQEQRYRPDPWEAVVDRYLAVALARRRDHVTTSDILVEALKKDLPQITESDGIRVGKILARFGWRRRQTRRLADDDAREANGKRRRAWVYYPPDAEVETDGVVDPDASADNVVTLRRVP